MRSRGRATRSAGAVAPEAFDPARSSGYNRRSVYPPKWACGAVGSAPEWHSGGHRFEPGQVHQPQVVDSTDTISRTHTVVQTGGCSALPFVGFEVVGKHACRSTLPARTEVHQIPATYSRPRSADPPAALAIPGLVRFLRGSPCPALALCGSHRGRAVLHARRRRAHPAGGRTPAALTRRRH